MVELSVLGLVGLYLMGLYNVFSNPRPKGTFTVRFYKNGELVMTEVYKDETFIVAPGDEFDSVHIEG